MLTTKTNCLYDAWLNYTFEKPNFDLVEKQYAETEQFFPTFTLPEIIAALSQAAAQCQVVLTSIKPGISKQKNLLQIFPITIALKGHYQQIINFINLIAEHNYFMLFDKIIMQPETNSLTLQATLQTMQLATENQISTKISVKTPTAITALIYSQQSGIPKSITNLRDPFNNESKTADLTSWPSSSLTLLGVYQIANKNWAIVTDPNGFIHQVTIGDHIGSRQSPIIAINKNAIETTNAIDNVYRSN
ncbi:MAG: pilus assembly protein PilP [Gammaproteobacteria bacterium]|nr:pilus assembly protein PilP [Gammaproteobacteria bacterium]